MQLSPNEQSRYNAKCRRCGTTYEVVIVNKRADHSDERVMCECGWPLKDWIGFRTYIFTRSRDYSRATVPSEM